MEKLNIGIIFGGKSSEHSVSENSAKSIIKNISKDKYNLFLIGIDKFGKWFLYQGDADDIPECKWEASGKTKPACILPDSSVGGLMVLDGNKYEFVKLDAVIPVLHGKNGEDGTIQGLLELAEIPYVGCHVLAASSCMDKAVTNILLEYNGITKPKFYWFNRYDFATNPENVIENIESTIKTYPMFIKPANAGSSVGITKANCKDDLVVGIKLALENDDKVVIEQGIDGKEVECAVLGNDELIDSVVGEIVPCNDFYDYEAKYLSGTSDLHIPARIPEDIAHEIRETAKKAYKIMGCKGLSRIDFFVENGTNKVYLNEINTFPGFTNISMYPKLMQAVGVQYSDLIDRLISLAINH